MLSLSCASCGSEMERANVTGVLVAGCPRCGSVWMDNVACHALAADQLSDAVLQFIDSMDAVTPPAPADDASPYRSQDRPQGACPVCDAALQGSQLACGVVLDVCSEHGTHFDRREVRAMRFAQAVGVEAERAAALRSKLHRRESVQRMQQMQAELESERRRRRLAERERERER